jgi:hypothetical protein
MSFPTDLRFTVRGFSAKRMAYLLVGISALLIPLHWCANSQGDVYLGEVAFAAMAVTMVFGLYTPRSDAHRFLPFVLSFALLVVHGLLPLNDSMSRFHPIPWDEFPAECLWYLAPMSLLHLIVFAIGCLVLAALTSKWSRTFLRRAGRLALFLGLLLVVGSVFNGLWSCMIWGRLYDSTDYVVDFLPFWPITQGVIDASFGDTRGQLLGVSLFELQLVWFAFAAGTWIVTFRLYRSICNRTPANTDAATNNGTPRVCGDPSF